MVMTSPTASPFSLLTTLQTCLDLYNSELALASSPVLFWNICVQLEIWISIVICGLAAVVGQASKPLLSLLTWQLPAAQEQSSISTSLPPPPPPSIPTHYYIKICTWKNYALIKTRSHKVDLSLLYQVRAVFMLRSEKGLPVITFYFNKTDYFVSQKLVFFHKSLVQNFKSLLNLIFFK
jgi:hypothetical protein